MPAYVNSSLIGVDFSNTSSTALFALGTHALGSGGTEFLYVEMATACSAYTAVCVNGTFTATGGDATNLLAGGNLAWLQTSAAAGEFAWVAIQGHITVMTSGSVTGTPQGVFLPGASGVTGVISNNYSASGTLQGVFFTSIAQTATATITGAVLVWPRGSAAAFY